MVSLLCLTVLFSGVLQSYAIIDLNSFDFQNKLQKLPVTVPVYIILSNKFNASRSDLRSTLKEVENSRSTDVYLHEIFRTAHNLSTNPTCMYGKGTSRTRGSTGSAAPSATSGKAQKNKANIRGLEEIKNMMISTEHKMPILVVSIYSEFNRKQIKNVKCWIRDVSSRRPLSVSKVKYQGVALAKAKNEVNSNVSATAKPLLRDNKIDYVFSRNRTLGDIITYRTVSSSQKPRTLDVVKTYTTESSARRPAVENKPEMDPEDSGTMFWAFSGSASKQKSRRSTLDTANRIPRSVSNDDGCALGGVLGFSFAQRRKNIERMKPSSNIHRTEPQWFPPQGQKSRDETSGSTILNSESSADDIIAIRPSNGYTSKDKSIDSSTEKLRLDGGLYFKQKNVGDGRTDSEKPAFISSSEEEYSEEWNVLNNFHTTPRSTVNDIKIPPVDPTLDNDPLLQNVPGEINNFYDLNDETNEGSSVWDSIHKGYKKTKSEVKQIFGSGKDAAKNIFQKVKSGFKKFKDFGHESFKTGSTVNDIKIPPVDPTLDNDPLLQNVPGKINNFYDLNDETNEGSNVLDSISNGYEKTKSEVKQIFGSGKDAAKNTFQKVKSGFTKFKDFGHESFKTGSTVNDIKIPPVDPTLDNQNKTK